MKESLKKMRKNRGLKDSQIQSPTSRKAGAGKPGMQEKKKGPRMQKSKQEEPRGSKMDFHLLPQPRK